MSIVFGNFQAFNIVEPMQSKYRKSEIPKIFQTFCNDFSERMEKADINKRFILAVNALVSAKTVATKGAISDALRVTQSKLSEILNERMNVGVDMLADLCHIYNISANWLLLGEGSMLRNEEGADHFPDTRKMIAVDKEVTEDQPDNGLTAFLQQENARLHTRITELERQNAVLSYRLEQMPDDK